VVVALQLAALVVALAAAVVALAAAVVALAAAVAVAVAWVPLEVRPVSALECSLGQALERRALERRQAALHWHYLLRPEQTFREDSSSDLTLGLVLQLAPELLLEEREQAVTASAGSPSVVASAQLLRVEEELLWLLADYSLELADSELFLPVHSPFEPLLLFSSVRRPLAEPLPVPWLSPFESLDSNHQRVGAQVQKLPSFV